MSDTIFTCSCPACGGRIEHNCVDVSTTSDTPIVPMPDSELRTAILAAIAALDHVLAVSDAQEVTVDYAAQTPEATCPECQRLREGLRAIMEIASTKTYCMCEADSDDPHELNCPVSIRLRIHTKADALLAGASDDR